MNLNWIRLGSNLGVKALARTVDHQLAISGDPRVDGVGLEEKGLIAKNGLAEEILVLFQWVKAVRRQKNLLQRPSGRRNGPLVRRGRRRGATNIALAVPISARSVGFQSFW